MRSALSRESKLSPITSQIRGNLPGRVRVEDGRTKRVDRDRPENCKADNLSSVPTPNPLLCPNRFLLPTSCLIKSPPKGFATRLFSMNALSRSTRCRVHEYP